MESVEVVVTVCDDSRAYNVKPVLWRADRAVRAVPGDVFAGGGNGPEEPVELRGGVFCVSVWGFRVEESEYFAAEFRVVECPVV